MPSKPKTPARPRAAGDPKYLLLVQQVLEDRKQKASAAAAAASATSATTAGTPKAGSSTAPAPLAMPKRGPAPVASSSKQQAIKPAQERPLPPKVAVSVQVPVSSSKKQRAQKNDKGKEKAHDNADATRDTTSQADAFTAALDGPPTAAMTQDQIEAARIQRRKAKKQRKLDVKAKKDAQNEAGIVQPSSQVETPQSPAAELEERNPQGESNRSRKKRKKLEKRLEQERLDATQNQQSPNSPTDQPAADATSASAPTSNAIARSIEIQAPSSASARKKQRKARRKSQTGERSNRNNSPVRASPSSVPTPMPAPVSVTGSGKADADKQAAAVTPTPASPPKAATQAGKKRKRSETDAASNTPIATAPHQASVAVQMATPAPVTKKRKVANIAPSTGSSLRTLNDNSAFNTIVQSLQRANPVAFQAPYGEAMKPLLHAFLVEFRGTGEKDIESGPVYAVVKDLCRKGLGPKLSKMVQNARRDVAKEQGDQAIGSGDVESGQEADIESAVNVEPDTSASNAVAQQPQRVTDLLAKKAAKRERQAAKKSQNSILMDNAPASAGDSGDVSMVDGAPSSPSTNDKRRRQRLGKKEKAMLRALASGESSRQSSIVPSIPPSPGTALNIPRSPVPAPSDLAGAVVPESPERAVGTPLPNDDEMDVDVDAAANLSQQDTIVNGDLGSDSPEQEQDDAREKSESTFDRPSLPGTPRLLRQSSEAQATSDADSEVVASLLSPRRQTASNALSNELAPPKANGVDDGYDSDDEAAQPPPSEQHALRPQDIPLPPSPSPETDDQAAKAPLRTIGQRDGSSSSDSDSDSDSSEDDERAATTKVNKPKRKSLFAITNDAFGTPGSAKRRPRVSMTDSGVKKPSVVDDNDDEIDELMSQSQPAPSTARQVLLEAERPVVDSGSDRSTPAPPSHDSSPEAPAVRKSPVKKMGSDDEPETEDDDVIAKPATVPTGDVVGIEELSATVDNDQEPDSVTANGNEPEQQTVANAAPEPEAVTEPEQTEQSTQPNALPARLTDIAETESSQVGEAKFDVEDDTESQDAFKKAASRSKPMLFLPESQPTYAQASVDFDEDEDDLASSALNTPAPSDGGLKPGQDLTVRSSPGPTTRAAARAASRSPAPEGIKTRSNGASPAVKPSASQPTATTTRSGRTSLSRLSSSQPATASLNGRLGSASTKRASSLRGLSQLDELADSWSPRKKTTKASSASQPTSTTTTANKRQWLSQGDEPDEEDSEEEAKTMTTRKSGKKLWA
ncbi:hypothetical protein OIV83_005600 [Microbotryomycetes sp. JL201]|nr:hypothetical protein OIV83_005600 [Microbotryomycetes sp. JL201]